MSEHARIRHRRFGEIEVAAEDVLRLEPLPGFDGAERFTLMAHDRGGIFAWLVSLDDPTLAFVVTDPLQFFPSYAPRVAEAARARIGAGPDDALDLLCLVTVRDGVPSLNLAAPLVLCAASRRGLQLLLDEPGLSTREPLPAPPQTAERAGDQIESKPPT